MQRRLVVGVLVVATLAAVATAVLGVVLAEVYRPLDPDDPWRDWHLVASAAFLLASATAAVLGLVRRSVLVPVCGAVATVAATATLLTRPLVAWDQVGLRSVTVGTDVSGYWTAAFDDEVVLVLVGGTEASPGEYAFALAAHLGAPVLGVAALLVATLAVARSVRRTPPGDVAIAVVPV